jgi:hypothetical protein
MVTCERCCELLWDHLYGLLEDGESERLRDHLAACAACQAQMTNAEGQRHLLSEAARLEVEIPPFVAPETDDEPVPALTILQPTVEGRRWRAWPWLASAAALLLAVGLPYGSFRSGLARHEAALGQADDRYADLVAQAAQMHQKAEADAKSLALTTRADHLRIQVFGPADYQPGSPCQYQISTSDLNLEPSEADLTARLVDEDRRVLAQATDLSSKGDLLVSLAPAPRRPPRGKVFLEVAVRGKQNLELRQPLHTLDVAYATHLALDRPVYRPGEKVLFRSVTLEGFGLRPPDRPMKIAFTVNDARGKVIYELGGDTRPGGIGGGEFTLPRDLPEGEYSMSVADSEDRFPVATRRFLVRRNDPSPTDATAAGPFQVEFFPEGGSLIGGVPNRVYFRARTFEGMPVELEGTLVDNEGREVLAVKTAAKEREDTKSPGLGVFTFIPQAGQSYRLRIDSPAGISLTPSLPPVRADGLALSVLTTVTREGQPIRLMLRQPGGERRVLLTVFCRGRLVAQQERTVKDAQEVEIMPPAGCPGVLRVVAFDARRGLLQPMAERLVYRVPPERLNLSIAGLKEKYRPGEPVKLTIRGTDPKGTPQAAWISVSAVNVMALKKAAIPTLASLPAYYYLMAELDRPIEARQAAFVMSDNAEAASALDLFLGTQGGRSSLVREEKAELAANNGQGRAAGKDRGPAAVVKLDNLQQATRDADAALEASLAALQQAVAVRDRELAQEAGLRFQQVKEALSDLDSYKTRFWNNLRLALGLGLLIVFGAGCVLLLMALVRLVRGLSANTPYFAGAFGALLLCVVTILSPANPWRGMELQENPQSRLLTRTLPKPLDQQALRQAAANPMVDNALVRSDQPRPKILMMKPGGVVDPPVLDYRVENVVAAKSTESEPINPSRPESGRVAPLLPKGRFGTAPVAPPLALHEYAYVHPKQQAGPRPEMPQTVLWQPALFAVDGKVQVAFDLPDAVASYHITVEGHSASGSLGAIEATLDCRPDGTGTEK